VDAVCHGLDDIPKIDPDIREALNDRFSAEGLKPLQQQLMEFDPVYYQQVDRQNPKRVIRALEVCITTGQPYSSFLTKEKKTRPFEIIKIGLELDRQLLYERINYRMDKMIENGLFEEARKLYPHKNLNALQTVGYTEIFHYLEGKYDRAEAIRLLKRNSRRYAKRQLTWFKKDQDIQWFQSGQKTQILRFLETKLKNSD